MHELMLLLAAKMPFEMLLETLEKALKDVRENPEDEEKIKHLSFACMLVGSRDYVNKSKNGDVMEAIKEMGIAARGIELLKPTQG